MLALAPDDLVCSACGGTYPVRDGVPDLVHPSTLAERDRRWQVDYDETAEKYDELVKTLAQWLECDWQTDRRRLAAPLGLGPGQTVLEVSVGTGANLPFLAEGLGGRGRIVALDLGPGMLAVARRKARVLAPAGSAEGGLTVDLLLANGSDLPFAPSTFDAVLHVGGINEYAGARLRRLGRATDRVMGPPKSARISSNRRLLTAL